VTIGKEKKLQKHRKIIIITMINLPFFLRQHNTDNHLLSTLAGRRTNLNVLFEIRPVLPYTLPP
jgi:hypothetical protein